MRIQKLMATATMAAMLFGSFGALQAAGQTKTIGNSKFGAYIYYGHGFRFNKDNLDTKAWFTPDIGGKLFGKSFSIFKAEANLGNYNTRSWAGYAGSKNTSLASNWKALARFKAFNITLYTKEKSYDGVKTHTIFNFYRYYKKSFPKIRFSVFGIPFSITYGATLSGRLAPTITTNSLALGVALNVLPEASVGAFAYGGPNLWLIRGGLGTQVTIFRGNAGLGLVGELLGSVAAIGPHVALKMKAGVRLMQGKIYAYVDRWKCRRWFKCGYKRWWTKDIIKWNGWSWNWERTISDWKLNLNRYLG